MIKINQRKNKFFPLSDLIIPPFPVPLYLALPFPAANVRRFWQVDS
jgi:hypothetical protein